MRRESEIQSGSIDHCPFIVRYGLKHLSGGNKGLIPGTLSPWCNPLFIDPALSRVFVRVVYYRQLWFACLLVLLIGIAVLEICGLPGGFNFVAITATSGLFLANLLFAIIVQRIECRLLATTQPLTSPAAIAQTGIAAKDYVEAHVLVSAAVARVLVLALATPLFVAMLGKLLVDFFLTGTWRGGISSDLVYFLYVFLAGVMALIGHTTMIATATAMKARVLTADRDLAEKRMTADYLKGHLLWIPAFLASAFALLANGELRFAFLFFVAFACIMFSVYVQERRILRAIRELESLAPLWWGEGADVNMDELTKGKWLGDWARPLRAEAARLVERQGAWEGES
ncbi:hypothetical protein KQI84_03260 [bacterium]|nr:hypothetical protein [bacterium]